MCDTTPAYSAVYDDGPRGFSLHGRLSESKQQLLKRLYDEVLSKEESEFQQKKVDRDIFWISIWQGARPDEHLNVSCYDEVKALAEELQQQLYADDDCDLDGFGFIINPVHSKTQLWHVDYTLDYSTIFVPMVELSPENATQYLVVPPSCPADIYSEAIKNLDAVNVELLTRHVPFLSVRQAIAAPYSLVKMQFGTIHRGISNRGTYDRVVFWLSVKKRSCKVTFDEPLVTVIPPEYCLDQ